MKRHSLNIAPAQESPVSMETVARVAGVSQMTVTRTLRYPELVSDSTRQRVLEAIRQLGYLPNKIAQGLATNRANLIGLVSTTLRNPLLASIVQGACDAIAGTGYQILLGMGGQTVEDEERVVREFLSYRPAAMILHRTTHTKTARSFLKSSGVIVVETGNLIARPIDSVVSFSNFEASKAMTAYLAGIYRRVGYIGLISRDDDRFRSRRLGYLAALREAKIEPDPGRLMEVPNFGPGGGGEALERLMSVRPDTEAVFFSGGLIASDVLETCKAHGWSVPSRLAIAGFDDFEPVFSSMAGITCVRIPRYEIGWQASQVVLGRLRGDPNVPSRVEYPFEIVLRETA